MSNELTQRIHIVINTKGLNKTFKSTAALSFKIIYRRVLAIAPYPNSHLKDNAHWAAASMSFVFGFADIQKWSRFTAQQFGVAHKQVQGNA
jgi:hypothetical protein